jgi:hypothetical protein
MTPSTQTAAIGQEQRAGWHYETSPARLDGGTLRTLTPGLCVRFGARVRAGSLDRALIAGADPASSTLLAARAVALSSPGTRDLIATGLERLIEAACGPQRRWCAVGRGDSILANAPEIRRLVAALRGDAPLKARGVAIVSDLLSDGAGPAYHGRPEDLARRLDEARMAAGC